MKGTTSIALKQIGRRRSPRRRPAPGSGLGGPTSEANAYAVSRALTYLAAKREALR